MKRQSPREVGSFDFSAKEVGLNSEQRQRLIDIQAVELRRLFLERPEAREAVIEMLDRARKVNEGRDGVIFLLDLSGMDEAHRESLQTLGFPVDDRQAIKTLKVNQRGKLITEFDTQVRAYNTLHPKKDKEKSTARVPKPTMIGDIELPEHIQDAMNKYHLQKGETAEIMMMDYIPAPDLATLLYQEVYVRVLPGVTREEIAHMQISDMANIVEGRVGMSRPGGKGATEGERLHEQRKIDTENFGKLVTWLASNGFVLRKSILEQLRQGIQSLHQAGIYHRDLHLRNVIVTGQANALEEGEAPATYIIDFGLSKTSDATSQTDPYMENGYRFLEDETILRQLEPLTKTKKERVQELVDKDLSEILQRAKQGRDPRKEDVRNETLRRIRTHLNTPEGTTKMLDWLFDKFGTKNERELYQLIDYLVELLDEGSLSPKLCSEFLIKKTTETRKVGRKKERVMPLHLLNILSRFTSSYVQKKEN